MYLPEGSIIEIQTKGSDYNTTSDGAIIITLYTYSFKDVANNTYFQSLTFNRHLNIFSLSVPQLKDKKS